MSTEPTREDIHGLLRGLPRRRIPFEEATPETYGRLYDSVKNFEAEVERLRAELATAENARDLYRDKWHHAQHRIAALTDERDQARAEVDRLRAKLDSPCGSCHPCVNYADETWRAAGRKPPHVHEWDETRALVDRLREFAFEGGQNGESARQAIIQAFVAHDAAVDGEGEFTPTSAEAERDRLAEQVKRVRQLHFAVVLGGTCTTCGHAAPCPTIRALDGGESRG